MCGKDGHIKGGSEPKFCSSFGQIVKPSRGHELCFPLEEKFPNCTECVASAMTKDKTL